MKLDSKQCEAVLAVLDGGSFELAAARLHLTSSAVSQRVRALEQVLGSVLIVQATIAFAVAILAEAALSYLGLGTPPPTASWGRMLSDSQSYLYQSPLLALWPGMAIAFSVLGFNLLGDGLRDLLDPKLVERLPAQG